MDDFEKNVVTVRIYGQEYTISGDMPREYIIKIADYVDGKMTEVGEGSSLPMSKVAILSAVNITDELFAERKNHSDCEKYVSMWEDAKNGYLLVKEDLAAVNEQKEELIRQNGEKDNQLGILYQQLAEEKKQNDVLRTKLAEVTAVAENAVAAPEEAKRHIEELEMKCRDIESSFFDIQMENIRLKNEIDMLRRSR